MIVLRIILLLLPLFAVLYYLRWRHRLKLSGRVADDEDLKSIRTILLSIIATLIVLLLVWRFLDTKSTDRYKIYVPPKVVDGKVVPAHFIDREEVAKPEKNPAPEKQE